jgi:hypothetical protein
MKSSWRVAILLSFLFLISHFFFSNSESLLEPLPLKASLKSPPQKFKHAYGTLCVGNDFVLGTLVLFHSLRKVEAQAGFYF